MLLPPKLEKRQTTVDQTLATAVDGIIHDRAIVNDFVGQISDDPHDPNREDRVTDVRDQDVNRRETERDRVQRRVLAVIFDGDSSDRGGSHRVHQHRPHQRARVSTRIQDDAQEARQAEQHHEDQHRRDRDGGVVGGGVMQSAQEDAVLLAGLPVRGVTGFVGMRLFPSPHGRFNRTHWNPTLPSL